MADHAGGALFRPIVPHQHSRVTYAELFFDLVFVFAVTQVSHTLLGRPTRPDGRTALIFLPPPLRPCGAYWWKALAENGRQSGAERVIGFRWTNCNRQPPTRKR